MENDEAFLTLLSAQRALLNRMNLEKAMKQELLLQQHEEQQLAMLQSQHKMQQQRQQQHVGFYPPMFIPPVMSSVRYYAENPEFAFASNTAPKMEVASEKHAANPFSLMNQSSLSQRRSSMDYYQASRRLSIGVGKDSLILPKEFGGEDGDESIDDDDWTSLKKESTSNGQEHSATVNTKTAARRRSSLGGLSALMADDMKSSGSRRFSLASNVSIADSMSFVMDDSHLAFEKYGIIGQRPQPEHSSNRTSRLCSKRAQGENYGYTTVGFDPSIDLPTLTQMVEDFASAMDSSSKSQQDIHDWDRKMGLKRSHSKTMRLSMRSRKKLRAIMKKERTFLKLASCKS
jgi:hypothetical protein